MHLIKLFDYLNEKCGPPASMPHDAHAHIWEMQCGIAPSIRVCVSTQEAERKASIWIFDPAAIESITYQHVHNQQELDALMSSLEARMNARSRQ